MRTRRYSGTRIRLPPGIVDHRSDRLLTSCEDPHFRCDTSPGRERPGRITDKDRRLPGYGQHSLCFESRKFSRHFVDKKDAPVHDWPRMDIDDETHNVPTRRGTYRKPIVEEADGSRPRRNFLPDDADIVSNARLELSRANAPRKREYEANGSLSFDGDRPVRKFLSSEDGKFSSYSTVPLSARYNTAPLTYSAKFSGMFPSSVSSAKPQSNDIDYLQYHGHGYSPSKESYGEDERQRIGKDTCYMRTTISEPQHYGNSSPGTANNSFGYSRTIGSVADNERFRAPEDHSHSKMFDCCSQPGFNSIKSCTGGYLSPISEYGEYRYRDLEQSDRSDMGPAPGDLYKLPNKIPQEDYGYNNPVGFFVNLAVDGQTSASSASRDNVPWDHLSIPGKFVDRWHNTERSIPASYRHGCFLGRTDSSTDSGTRPPQDDIMVDGGDPHGFHLDASEVDGCRNRFSPPMMRTETQNYRVGYVPKKRTLSDLTAYDPSGGLTDRSYTIDEIDGDGQKMSGSNHRSVFRRIQKMDERVEEWIGEDSDEWLPASQSVFGRMEYKLPYRSFNCLSRISDDFPPHVKGAHQDAGFGKIKRKLKTIYSSNQGLYHKVKRMDDYGISTSKKETFRDKYRSGSMDLEEPSKGAPCFAKSDPPEGSVEFKQLVHKAFLRYSKQLNENSAQQRKYLEQGNIGSLTCIVCGSLSKEFGDTHSLVIHTFNTKCSRVEHLGLHRALCIMMGWHSGVTPDNSKQYQSVSDDEASALKHDLILWPPVVLIHYGFVGHSISNAQMAVTCEAVEKILKEMGFIGGRMKVCQATANPGLLFVKFMPTFSGLQDAERLHNYYSEKYQGRKEMQQIVLKSSAESGNVGLEPVLYGYLGTAEDVCRLDHESKKRCVIKSRKEIDAIADATLNSE